METRTTTSEEKQALEFLNGLRLSGIVNMFGATPNIQEEFGCDKVEAKRLLTLWMENFNDENKYETVKT